MTHFDIKSFLENGAFVRDSHGKFYLWTFLTGQAQTVSEDFPAGRTASQIDGKNKENHIIGLSKAGAQFAAEPVCNTDNRSKDLGVFYRHFFAEQTETVGHGSPISLSLDQFRNFLLSLEPSFGAALSREDFVEPAIDSFEQSFTQIQDRIRDGRIVKAVPIVFATSAKVPNIYDRQQMILRLLDKTAPSENLKSSQIYPYGYWQAERGGVLGATPEVLFDRQGSLVRTMALAGTLPRNPLPTAQSQLAQIVSDGEKAMISELDQKNSRLLFADPKERHEHQLVVEDILSRLKSFGFVRQLETEVVVFPKLYHLRTLIELQLEAGAKNGEKIEGVGCGPVSENSWREMLSSLLSALHPTAALGLYPRSPALVDSWFARLPNQAERGVFGAPVVFEISQEKVIALVAIRSMLWDKDGARIGSGCGIVSDSLLEKEWRELATKREYVYDMLGLN